MNMPIEPNANEMDDLIAFTDQVLEGQLSTDTARHDAGDKEQHRDRETILALKRSISDDTPTPAMRERIRANLSREFQEVFPQRRPEPVLMRLYKRLFPQKPTWVSGKRQQNIQALRFATTAALVLLVAFYIFPKVETTLTGAAVDQVSLQPLVLLVGSALLVWLYLRNQKK
jgi:hypothetical protein